MPTVCNFVGPPSTPFVVKPSRVVSWGTVLRGIAVVPGAVVEVAVVVGEGRATGDARLGDRGGAGEDRERDADADDDEDLDADERDDLDFLFLSLVVRNAGRRGGAAEGW
jgi:hypothetical protein